MPAVEPCSARIYQILQRVCGCDCGTLCVSVRYGTPPTADLALGSYISGGRSLAL